MKKLPQEYEEMAANATKEMVLTFMNYQFKVFEKLGGYNSNKYMDSVCAMGYAVLINVLEEVIASYVAILTQDTKEIDHDLLDQFIKNLLEPIRKPFFKKMILDKVDKYKQFSKEQTNNGK